MKKINKKSLIKIIGLIIFISILSYKINFKEFYHLINNLNPLYLLSASLLMLIPAFIKVVRWHYVLKKMGINCRFFRVYKIFYLSVILGYITPAYVGEAVGMLTYLKSDNHNIGSSLTSIVIDRLNDIIILLIMTIIGIVFFLPIFKIKSLIVATIFLLVIVFILFGIKIKSLKKLLKKLFFILVPKKFQEKLKKYLKNISTGLDNLTIKNILIIIILSLLAYFFLFLFLYVLALIMGITQIPTLALLSIYAITRFVMMIPITIAGFGTREISIITLFSLFSVSSEVAVVYSLLIFLLNFIPNILIGSYFWLTEPLLSFKKLKKLQI